jgi:hypothetical protein
MTEYSITCLEGNKLRDLLFFLTIGLDAVKQSTIGLDTDEKKNNFDNAIKFLFTYYDKLPNVIKILFKNLLLDKLIYIEKPKSFDDSYLNQIIDKNIEKLKQQKGGYPSYNYEKRRIPVIESNITDYLTEKSSSIIDNRNLYILNYIYKYIMDKSEKDPKIIYLVNKYLIPEICNFYLKFILKQGKKGLQNSTDITFFDSLVEKIGKINKMYLTSLYESLNITLTHNNETYILINIDLSKNSPFLVIKMKTEDKTENKTLHINSSQLNITSPYTHQDCSRPTPLEVHPHTPLKLDTATPLKLDTYTLKKFHKGRPVPTYEEVNLDERNKKNI